MLRIKNNFCIISKLTMILKDKKVGSQLLSLILSKSKKATDSSPKKVSLNINGEIK